MKLPIVAYGSSVLRKINKEIDENYPNLKQLIADMYETMYKSDGVGLAAPQINKNIRLFVIDANAMEEDDPNTKDFKQIFINAKILEEEGKEWKFNEGCLSVPDVREDIIRKPKIHIQFYDENFNFHDKYFDGLLARIIQHEYDHTDGKLFVDRLSPLRKRLIKGKLNAITKGKVRVSYKMIFPK